MKPTVAEVYERCEEVGDCMVWRGPCCNHVPQFYRSNGPGSGTNKTGTYHSCRRLVYEELSGKPIKKGLFPVATCRDKLCVKFEHIKLLTHKQIGALAAKEGKFSTPQRCAAISTALRKSKNAKLTIEQVREIRASPETGRAIAKRMGVDKSLPCRIRRNEAWCDGAPNNSVFNMRA